MVNMNTCILTAWLLYCVLGTLAAKPKTIAEFTKVECENLDPEILKLFTCNINQTQGGKSGITAEFELHKDMVTSSGLFILAIEHGNKFFNYTTVELDYCKALHSIQDNYLTQMIAVGIRRVSNLPLDCPFKKHVLYYVRDFTIDPKIIPPYMPHISFKMIATVVANQRLGARLTVSGHVGRK